jgi:oligo-1,6-glucosidase
LFANFLSSILINVDNFNTFIDKNCFFADENPKPMICQENNWWKEAIVYQIYPRSFKDSNGDGIGDLQGIVSKLDHLKDLGVDVVWLSPFYKSPNADNGYDISDYQDIMSEFGTMPDFDDLLRGIHERGMKLMIDLVVNHCSDEHTWFQQSRLSKDSPYRDYFIWKPAKPDGSPPNNWRSFFSGPAWQWDETTQEYYLHLFVAKQPDLNWENPKLRQDIYNMMHFWLKKGVDGFRMDVIAFLSKDQTFPDSDGSLEFYANGPRIHEFLKEMNQEVLSKYDIMTVGEAFGVSTKEALDYVGKNEKELQMVFHFDHAVPRDEINFINPAPEWTLPQLKSIFQKWDTTLKNDGWNSIYWGNHDNPRILSRLGDTKRYRVKSAKMLATILLTLRGTPYIYQGDEIGMTNCPFTKIEEYDDVQVKNAWNNLIINQKQDPSLFLKAANKIARDHARTPMQWNDSENGGFIDGTSRNNREGGKTWLKMNPNFTVINVQADSENPDSILNYYKKLILFRKDNLVLVYGTFEDILPNHEKLYAYIRTSKNEQLLILNNVSNEKIDLKELINNPLNISTLLMTNFTTKTPVWTLQPYESRIYRIK